MKTTLIKLGLILILSTTIGLQKGFVQPITIYGYGNYMIYDPTHLTATFDVYAAIESTDLSIYPNTTYPTPIASGIYQGTYPSGGLQFNNVYFPYPLTPTPFRVVIYVRRTYPSAQNRIGISGWADQYGFSPWSPNPIRVQEFN
jgi:hypothetical protein